MSLRYRLVGYDRVTDRMLVHFDIPNDDVWTVKQIARVSPLDDGLGAYPLDNPQARDIAGLLRQAIDTERCEFFLEPFAEPSKRPVPELRP
jgi:hypothetical protein